MARSMSTPPRIYYLAAQAAADAAEPGRQLARCAEMGFDHLLCAPPGAPDACRALADACAATGLQPLFDLDLRAPGADRDIAHAYPHWFHPPGPHDDLPDPRRLRHRPLLPVPRYDREDVTEEITGYWRQHLQSMVACGAAGFRCLGAGEVPPSLWRTLIDAGRALRAGLRFFAWTPGCTPAQLEGLASCGFDATFSSGAWWDYRSRWLADEQQRLARIAPPLAFPDSPDEAVLGRLAGNEEAALRRQLFVRALRLAAATGNGMLVPMGFEYGLSGLTAGAAVGWAAAREAALFDLSAEIAEANAFIAARGAPFRGQPFRMLSSADARVAVLLRDAEPAPGVAPEALLIVANPDSARPCRVGEGPLLERAGGYLRDAELWAPPEADAARQIELGAGALRLFVAHRLAPIVAAADSGPDVTAAARSPRIAIEAVAPAVDGGRFPVKRTVGESVEIGADVFADGHDKLAVAVLWRAADDSGWHETRMHALGNDRWSAQLPLTRIGRYLFVIEAWRDVFATYRDELEKKTTAGLNVAVELEEGRLLVEAALRHARENGLAATAVLAPLAQALKPASGQDEAAHDASRIATLLSEPLLEAMRDADARPFAVRSEPMMQIDAERTAARFSSWYELFPRSQSGDPNRHGTFADVEKRLPEIQAMGFDTLYFPPIHPIGRKHRKGRNNSLTAGPGEPGSPYAIGAEEGGHDALHPELGTLDDFRHLRDAAARHGLELAIDFAIQCSPDHPWLKQHPDWFAWRPDGTIRYAENPPKKYQDIVNVDFYAGGAVPDLWIALRDVVQFWVNEGVRVFRVDNPHTKPLPFWEWMIADIRGRHPDTIFLSEAFTRPKVMYRLAKVGYSQSYTYFTWRHTKQEFIDYLTELTTTSVRDFFRPHFFVNTPDINPVFLQRSGRPGFLIRAALATTLSGLWGMYSGFELCEGTPVPGKEEYLDSEKYEIRAWDWHRPGNIIAEITQLNRIRIENPALQTHLNIRFLHASGEHILFFMKWTSPADGCGRVGDNVVLIAINLDPFHAHEATLELPLWEFGLPDDGTLDVTDLIGGAHQPWRGRRRHIQLDPFSNPYAIWRVRGRSA